MANEIAFYRHGSGMPERQLGCLYWMLEDLWYVSSLAFFVLFIQELDAGLLPLGLASTHTDVIKSSTTPPRTYTVSSFPGRTSITIRRLLKSGQHLINGQLSLGPYHSPGSTGPARRLTSQRRPIPLPPSSLSHSAFLRSPSPSAHSTPPAFSRTQTSRPLCNSIPTQSFASPSLPRDAQIPAAAPATAVSHSSPTRATSIQSLSEWLHCGIPVCGSRLVSTVAMK